MPDARWIGLVAVLSLAWLRPSDAAACSILAVGGSPYDVDTGLKIVDSTAPDTFSGLSAETIRSRGSEQCGSAAGIELSFVAPNDDAESPLRSFGLGYRVVWLSGNMPASMQYALETPQVFSGDTLTIMVEYDDIVELDGEMALIAIDHAGNESEPSAPVHVAFGGCTFYRDDRACLEDANSCSVRAAGAERGAWLWPVIGLGASVALRRWSRRSGVRS